jgi:hypothetical protein
MLANEDKKDMEKDELFDFVTGDIVKRESLGKVVRFAEKILCPVE